MEKINVMFFAFGKNYEYDENKIQISNGIISKSLDTINFVDVKDIRTKTNIFGWGTITIVDNNGERDLVYVKKAKEVHSTLNDIFLEHKNRMKKVDIS